MPRILGVDYGTRRVGFAISDELGVLSLPLCTKDVASVQDAVRIARKVADERKAIRVVVGLPLNMDGTKGSMAHQVERFVDLLRAGGIHEVITWDERLSTGLVERMLIDADVSRSRRKEVRDKLAAQVILQGYLDSLAGAPNCDAYGLDPSL